MKKTYTREQVIEASTKYFNGDALAAEVFANKYSLKNDKIEHTELDPSAMHKRLAKEFDKVEA